MPNVNVSLVPSRETSNDPGTAAIERYLASREIKGVGRRLARRIAEHFGSVSSVEGESGHQVQRLPIPA